MQAIKLSLYDKTAAVPVLYAKQGDVGRKFKAIITDGTVGYTIPGDAALSVWYSGASGEGNYTKIGDRSAFVVEGDTVTVELITQMLNNKGNGKLCLYMSKADGTQLGTWNIPYVVEEVPGFDSEGAKEYYNAFSEVVAAAKKLTVDKTLSRSGSAADAAETGRQISVERARIDNLTTLKEGSTTGDAELADIRVGFNGTVYATAGEAVRKQVEIVGATVGALADEVGIDVPLALHFVPGYMSSGGLTNNTYTIVAQTETKELTTDFIPLYPDRWFEATIETDAGDSNGWLRGYIFDKDMNIIYEHHLYGKTGKNTLVFTEENIPNGAYIRLSFRSFGNAKVRAQYFSASSLTRNFPYYHDKNDVTLVDTTEWVKGYTNATTGAIVNTQIDPTHNFTSGMIAVTPGKEYRVFYDVTNNTEETDYFGWVGLTAYKSDGTFVARYDYPITEKSDTGRYSNVITKTFVEGIAYFRVSCRYYENATLFVGEVKTGGIEVDVDAVIGMIDSLCPSFTESGGAVVCEPLVGSLLSVTASEEATKITRCGKNLIPPEAITASLYNVKVWNSSGIVLPAGTYTASINVTCLGIYANDPRTSTRYAIAYGSNKLTFTLTEPSPVHLDFYSEPMPEDAWTSVMLEVGMTATAYEPYNGDIFTIGRDVPSLEGINVLYADSGNITVTGKNNPMKEIEKLSNEIELLKVSDSVVKAVAHRGLSSKAPENTIPAYQAAKKAGFKYVECDVQFTSDGVPVLSHDNDLAYRTGDVLSGDIETHTLEELKSADFGVWFSAEFAGTKIPTLEEFVDYCRKASLHPYIELKGGITSEQALLCLEIVRNYGMEDKVTWIGAEIGTIAYKCLELGIASNARYGFVNYYPTDVEFDVIEAMRSQGIDAFIDANSYENTYLDRAKSLNIPYEVWTINTEEEILNLPPYISGVTSDILHAGRVLAASAE